jgi:hypothetical protein
MKRRWDIDPTSPAALAATRATSGAKSRAAGWSSHTSAFRSLVANGFAADEAGNLTALRTGLWPAERAWSLIEINRLHFLLFRMQRDRIET